MPSSSLEVEVEQDDKAQETSEVKPPAPEEPEKVVTPPEETPSP